MPTYSVINDFALLLLLLLLLLLQLFISLFLAPPLCFVCLLSNTTFSLFLLSADLSPTALSN